MLAINAILGRVPAILWAGIAAALLIVCGAQRIEVAVIEARLSSAQKELAEVRESHAVELAKAHEDSRKKERELGNAIDKTNRDKNAEINTLRATVRTLRDRLRDLPERPTSEPRGESASFGQAPIGCPGPVLYRDTAEALTDEAERADLIRIELKAVYAKWDSARKACGGPSGAVSGE